MRMPVRRVLAVLAALPILLAGCSTLRRASSKPAPSAAASSALPFDGLEPVPIPPDAHAMGAFLKAEVATNEGDREEALKEYEQAVRYDPDNAELLVRLATLYVRDGRLKETLAAARSFISGG